MEGKEKPKPKRRGRKPKKKEVAKVETNKLTDSLIIKLNCLLDIESYIFWSVKLINLNTTFLILYIEGIFLSRSKNIYTKNLNI